MEMSFAKWPSALKMRLRLASACPSPFAYASLQPEQGPVTYVALRASKYAARNTCVATRGPSGRSHGKKTASQLASGELVMRDRPCPEP